VYIVCNQINSMIIELSKVSNNYFLVSSQKGIKQSSYPNTDDVQLSNYNIQRGWKWAYLVIVSIMETLRGPSLLPLLLFDGCEKEQSRFMFNAILHAIVAAICFCVTSFLSYREIEREREREKERER
jgi:hypothetical protein